MRTVTQPGQVWEETYDYGSAAKQDGFIQPTLDVMKVQDGYAHGIRRPSNRRTKVKLAVDGSIAGYRIIFTGPCGTTDADLHRAFALHAASREIQRLYGACAAEATARVGRIIAAHLLTMAESQKEPAPRL